MSVYNDRAKLVGDECVALLRHHEEREHDGERCLDETTNLIAYLCHRVGLHFKSEVDMDDLELFRQLVARNRDYASIHAEHHVGETHA